MIKKIKTINNLAVFQNFEWDTSVVDQDNRICEFKDINILYGRNYSGKTTLSRIFRAMEKGSISDKYENPEFCVSMKDGDDVTQNSLQKHEKKIRVFNEDFVKDNLRFISDPDGNIESFAILGTDNNLVEQEIKTLQTELGSNEETKETGLYADLTDINTEFQEASKKHQSAENDLDEQLKNQATDRKIGIKYQSERFGDQNYTKPKLVDDIRTVLKSGFEVITNEKQNELNKLIEGKALVELPDCVKINLQFDDFSKQTKQLVEKEIGVSNKITEIINDTRLNKWVKEGLLLHKNKRETCAFCSNEIKEPRWSELDKHFDEESENLENEIDGLIDKIKGEKDRIEKGLEIDKSKFYSDFHSNLESLSENYNIELKKYNRSLDELDKQLTERKNNLISPKEFQQPDNYEQELTKVWSQFESICKQSNKFTESLTDKKTKAKNSLRLREVSDFAKTIKYSDQIKNIKNLKKKKNEINSDKDKLDKKINKKTDLIGTKKKLLKDESKGADKVNEYLNKFFGHQFLSLKAVESQDEYNVTKKFKFEITRDGKKAYHLSEGENNLIAFCYFMAKLEDIETKNTKPIIWIDDPVSSLDGNHVFFVYSLIKAKIVEEGNFYQLFISTHSLDFLRYLKRIKDGLQNDPSGYFIVNRLGKISSIEKMPEYLKKYITEFNYLFHAIYKCSKIEEIDDKNYIDFYNFGNNARKFLEMFLYYKYPDNSKQIDKLKKFFGGDEIPPILINRINNEYSHLLGALERGAVPIEIPEMKLTASRILNRIKETDKDQYEALLKSIK